jgi:hypothetical protein
MRIIEMKLPVKYFEKDRDNHLEARLARFELEKGDIIRFNEWDEEKDELTGRHYDREVNDFHRIGKAVKYWSREDLEKYGLYVIEFK